MNLLESRASVLSPELPRKNKFTNITAGDRFIPRRCDANIEVANYLLNKIDTSPIHCSCNKLKYVNHVYQNWKKKQYQNRLQLLIGPKSKNILNIIQASQTNKRKNFNASENQYWPVHARNHPLIRSPILILDMPDLQMHICHNIVDWSSNGCMVSVFQKELYFWNPKDEHSHQGTYTNGQIGTYVKWNVSGSYIAITLTNKLIAIWDCAKKEISYRSRCLCMKYCTITSLSWSSNDLLISGCVLGRLSVWNKQLILLKTIPHGHKSLIIKICLSCQERYLATASADGIIKIWTWPQINLCFNQSYINPTMNIAWHPWKDSLLAVGYYNKNVSISIWSINNQATCLGYRELEDIYMCMDALTWNEITGELVFSCWIPNLHDNTNGHSHIFVLSDLHTIVDSINWHFGRVQYLLWGNKGKTLATVGTDEELCLWNFFGNAEEKNKLIKSTKLKQSRINYFENLLSFSQTIR